MRQQQQNTPSKLLTVLFVFLVLSTTIFMVQYARRVQGASSSVSYPIYEGSLAPGWKNWSLKSRVNLANPSPVYAGTTSIAFTPTQIGAVLYLHTNTAVDISPYTFLHFAARASRTGQAYDVMLYDAADHELSHVHLAHYGGNPVAGRWKVYNIPLADLRANATQISGVALQSRTRRHGTLYLASISLTSSTASLTPTSTLTSTADPTATATSTADPTGTAPTTAPTAAPTTAPSILSSSGQAIPMGDIAGWHQVFADDFNGTTLNTSNWGAYSGQPGGDRAGWFDPSHVIVSGGLLTLKGYKDAAAKPGVFVTGGIGGSHAQTYGKYLVRMRVDKGDGISATALLWPQAHVWPPEVDFFEDGGGARGGTSATLHCGPNGNDSCRVQKHLSGYDFSQWHTLGVEWTAGKLVYTIDGTTWATVTGSGVPSIPMDLDLQSVSLECSQYTTCLDSSTPAEVDMQVDWVVAYAPA